MALSNRDRIGRMFEIIAPVLDEFISSTINAGLEIDGDWTLLVAKKDEQNGITEKDYDRMDPLVQLRMLTEKNILTNVKKNWYPFSNTLGHLGESYAKELREARNTWAHLGSFSDDEAHRDLYTAELLMNLLGQPSVVQEINRIRTNLRRVTAEKDEKKILKAAADNPESSGLKPWREVLQPRDDVATGNFHASEFAADLFKVANRGEVESDYADPVEFFNRTYLTEGLSELLSRAISRVTGNDNASPVINLQTNFGGGKTHSMLALWHVAAGLPLGAFPQEAQELFYKSKYTGQKINRVAIVGNHFSPSGVTKPDGTKVNTVWGELAWQLGGREAFEIVAQSDSDRTPPGEALHVLLERYSPAIILIDEWVAYARSLVGRDDLAGGTFDDQFTFAQSLTEAVKGTSGVLLAISIPASERGYDEGAADGNAEEVGGANGIEALKRLQNVVRRVADQWRPASSDESYHIVKQRLFEQPDAAALADINATAKAFVNMYRKHSGEFPSEALESAYEKRLKNTYPIHPELFDTLYEEWSSLERFQRTRGVLRLMAKIIHTLWVGDDASPMIMTGSLPLATASVNGEIAQYLPDSWKAVVDADVDGPNSEPMKIDKAKPVFGQRALTKRLARTVFFGAAPTIAPGSTNKGITSQRVFLGTAVPGDLPGNFHSALSQLSDRATYFYSGSGKYWYDLKPNITRTAKDQADQLHQEEVWAEILKRLQNQGRNRGSFAGLHICPETNADIPDIDEARLVVLHPKVSHKRKSESRAAEFAQKATEQRGTANRTHRNMLVFLAADEARLDELDSATRDYLGWSHVLENDADLDLTQNQRKQAAQRKSQADVTVNNRLLQTFIWALVPTQPDPGMPFHIRETKVEGQDSSLAERVSARLGSDGDLATTQAAATIRLAINKVPQIWQEGHVSLGQLWSLYTQYPYMPRLKDRKVLNHGVSDMPMIWQTDGFALAASYDEEVGRYVDLWVPSPVGDKTPPAPLDSMLIVRPDKAERQIGSEKQQSADDGHMGTSATTTVSSEDGVFTPTTTMTTGASDVSQTYVRLVKNAKYRARFEVDTSAADSIGAAVVKAVEEVLRHIVTDEGVENVEFVLDIRAENTSGFSESAVRTVKENSRVLGFDISEFEDVEW